MAICEGQNAPLILLLLLLLILLEMHNFQFVIPEMRSSNCSSFLQRKCFWTWQDLHALLHASENAWNLDSCYVWICGIIWCLDVLILDMFTFFLFTQWHKIYSNTYHIYRQFFFIISNFLLIKFNSTKLKMFFSFGNFTLTNQIQFNQPEISFQFLLDIVVEKTVEKGQEDSLHHHYTQL